MKRHYKGMAERMLSEIDSISDQMSHAGEKGRNNEAVIREFLKQHLPTRYTVSTGKVVGVDGAESGQVDLIIHDRLTAPAFIDGHEWSLVPIETVFAVIPVKTTLNKSELRDAMKSIESVRRLPRRAATMRAGDRYAVLKEDDVLRPRAYIFAYNSKWNTHEGLSKAFIDLLQEFDDSNRPNGVCCLNQGLILRRPFTCDTVEYIEYPLLHFLNALVLTMNNRPTYGVDWSQYFADSYGQTGA